MFPYPSGIGLHVGHPLGYIATDVLRPLQADDRAQRAARAGLRRVRPARRAVRRADRPAPAGHHRGEHRDHARAAAPAGAGARPAPQRRDHRPGVLPLDAVDLPADLQRWYDDEAGRARPIAELEADAGLRRPAGAARRTRRRRRRPVGRPGRAGPPPGRRRAPAGLPVALAGQLVPGPGHRAGQRGGHRRRAQRPRQLPGLQAQPAPVDDADHRVRGPAAGRPGRAGLAGVDQAAAAQLDRPLGGRAGRVPQRRPARSRSSRPGRTRCSAPRSWCWRPSTRWSTCWPPAPGATDVPQRRGPAERRRRATRCRAYRRADRAAHRPGAADRGPREDRRLHRRLRDQPGQRRGDPGLRRRLRADGLRHRRDHGRARPGRARLGVRDQVRPADRAHRRSRPRAGRARRTPARGRRSTRPTTRSAWTGCAVADAKARIIDWLEEQGPGRAHGHLQAARLAVQPAALLGRAVPGRLRRARPAASPLPESMLPVELPEVDDYSPQTFAEDDATQRAGAAAGPQATTGSR